MRNETANILAFLDRHALTDSKDIAIQIANDFRQRRIEKNITREDMAKLSGIALSNISRFEQTGMISLKNLIGLATALGYTAEIRNIFSDAKFSTMEELTQIRENANRKKAYRKSKANEKNR